MSKTRNLSDLLDANGDVKSTALDNVPASNDASALTTGTIDNARLPSNISITGSLTTGDTPTISNISPTVITNSQTAVTITGTNFQSVPKVEVLDTTNNTLTSADSVSFSSSTSIVANLTIPTDSDYKIRVENPSGQAVLSGTALLQVSDAPTWSTASGSLGEVEATGTGTFTVSATSDSTVSYSLQSGSLPTGFTLNTSTGEISGTESGGVTTDTTYTFTIRATDGESQTADRQFSILISVTVELLGNQSFQRNHTTSDTISLTLPAGTKSIIIGSTTLSNGSVNRVCTGMSVAGNSMTLAKEHNYTNSVYRVNSEIYVINYTGSGTTSLNVTYNTGGGNNYGAGIIATYLSKEFSNTTPSDNAGFNGNSGNIDFYADGIVVVVGCRGSSGTAFTNMTYNAERGRENGTDYWVGSVQPTSSTTNQSVSSNASDSIRNGTAIVSYAPTKF